jgi:hypothetical protein
MAKSTIKIKFKYTTNKREENREERREERRGERREERRERGDRQNRREIYILASMACFPFNFLPFPSPNRLWNSQSRLGGEEMTESPKYPQIRDLKSSGSCSGSHHCGPQSWAAGRSHIHVFLFFWIF